MSATELPEYEVSVVIPTFNQAIEMDATLKSVRALDGIAEVIVVDGGSTDGTAACAQRAGARVLQCEPARGKQLQFGAIVAHAPILWFVYPGAVVPRDAIERMQQALDDLRVIGGAFRIRCLGDFVTARLVTWLYAHLARVGLRYGISAYFVWREAYEAAGGFKPLPVFDDLDLLARLKQSGRFARPNAHVTISSSRFTGRSLPVMFAGWTLLHLLYWLGVPPRILWQMSRRMQPRSACGFPRLAQTQEDPGATPAKA